MKSFFDRTKKLIPEKFESVIGEISGLPVMEFEGRKRLRIGNHKGIVKYTQSEIIVSTALGSILVSGEGMVIAGILDDEMMIKGDINGVRYLT